MNNENFKTTSTSASISNNYTTNISATTVTSLTALTPLSTSVSSPLPVSSFAASTSHFDATVNAIAAAVNASTNLSGTPPDAAVVVAVAVSSLAAAIIPDTPIVSIAGLTLSEITTTTTSTRTTPTPVPTNKDTNPDKNPIKQENLKSKSSDSLQTLRPSSSTSVKQPHHQMSVANLPIEGAITNATCSASSVAADNENQTITFTSSKATVSRKADSSPGITSTVETSLSPIQPPSNANVSATKCDAISDTPNESKSKDILSDSWEERRLNDWDDNELKELLDEAYSYKTPRDKENKSKTFLQLLEKVQNDDQSYKLHAINSRGTRNLSSSISSSSYHHYQNPHYHSHSHNNNNRSHHHHKQGGSLQDLFEIGLHETQLDCDQSFGSGIGGNQRNRRQNHNSRQKKFSSSVSSRQREGGSLPSNVNVTHQLSGSTGNELGFMQQEIASANCKANKKEQRRNASKANAGGLAPLSLETKDSSASSTVDTSPTQHPAGSSSSDTTGATTFVTHGGDFIIDMGEPIIDIQQQQQILQGKGPDSTKQGQSYYERLVSIDKHIPRVNLIGSSKSTYFAPTTSHCYVDETVRFNTLERNGVIATTNNSNGTPTTVDTKFLPLDENYKACKSVLGGEGEKSLDQIGKPKTNNSIYSKITPPAGSSGIGGAPNNIGGTINQSPLDENGNALNEIYQNSSAVGATVTRTIMPLNCVTPSTAIPASAGILLTSCGGNNVSTSATVTIPPHPTSNSVSTSATITTYATGPSQAKAKAKKKSQQERNTKTVDVESVAGYRGKDPVEELVKYIESSGEGGSSKSGDKKKERKKDKEKHQKLKKSNSLEELRSGAKMEVHELKRTAATTESNAVVLRQKSGGSSGGKQGKNNSSSTADINKHLDNKSTNSNTRKSERRSWGNEDLKYISDQQNANIVSANEEKSVAGPTTTNISVPILPKERKNVKGGTTFANKEEREIKERTSERNERNLTNNVPNNINVTQLHPSEKIEKTDKLEKAEKTEKTERRKRYDTPPNAVTIIDIVPMESSCPETAEFHVVTKKKKPKKPKVITNSEETSVTFNRTHNFTIPKSSTQSIPRYKYHQQDGNNLSGNQHSLQQNSNSIGGVGGSGASNNYSPSTSSQYPHSSETYNNTDKSRRKSTSSVPPSEKSDSSDLDSVHSLPIESTKANTTKDSSQSKTRAPKSGIPSLAQSKNNSNAPISYADIARTNKEIADAAAAFTVSDPTSFESKTPDSCVVEDRPSSDDKSNVTSNPIKTQKSKKSNTKQDFPELVNPVSVAPVSYSQSLSTTANATQIQLTAAPQSNEATPPTTHSDVIPKASLPQDQCHPPQTLQKSKSVENDFTTSNTTSSYMVPLNSNSLDQQYPALEKTVKRHSSANIGANYMIPNQQTSTFNFAAAAKQQISTSNTEPTHVNSNKNSALTTSITSTNTQTAQIIPGASNAINAINANSITSTNTNITNNTNRKSKEKSPPITSQNTTQETMNSKKLKKERQQLQTNVDVSTATQTKASSSFTARKPYRSQPKSSSSLALTASAQANPRPAVIILNDDRNSSGCGADNQFTFGDFNEDELKLFEDDVTSNNKCTDCNTMNALDTPSELTEDQKDPCDGETSNIISQGETYFNDSGASCENDIGNNSASDMLLNSSIDASSPNTSFANNIHTSRGGGAGGHMSAGNNQSSDSGIYTDRTKTTSSCYQQTAAKQNKQTSPIKDDNKLNTFLSNTKCTSVHTSMDSLDPPPQQLETCNEIETAIIAAARAAAKNQQQNPQQQKFKISNSSSNSSSFSSSSLSSNTAVATCHSNNSQILNQHVFSYGSNNQLPNENQQLQQLETQLCHVADNENDESFDNTQQRSRSPSRPRRISIQFIPPTMATALTTQQHNEIIVDFIGSAWEEIANSKVTKVYDGQ